MNKVPLPWQGKSSSAEQQKEKTWRMMGCDRWEGQSFWGDRNGWGSYRWGGGRV